jgi:adenosylcobinamide-phosphate synthase
VEEIILSLCLSSLLLILFDFLIGDPRGNFHPIVLLGRQIVSTERFLRSKGWDGYWGGILLLIWTGGTWSCGAYIFTWAIALFFQSPWIPELMTVLVASIFLAQRSLMEHGCAVSRACQNSIEEGRYHTSMLVGRDVSQLDKSGCRRATVESLAENFVDGVFSPLFWFAVLGLPGMVFFKVVSTLDSMVGYKNETYLRLGWAGARMDDVMNFIPARLSVIFISLIALIHPYLSIRKCVKVAFSQHQWLPSPNSGWSEAAVAGALQKRLCGPIYKKGTLACTVWVGSGEDLKGCSDLDISRTNFLIVCSTMLWLVFLYILNL